MPMLRRGRWPVARWTRSPRSFVRTSVYFGPDRRRRKDDNYKGKDRRENLFGPKGASILARATENAA